MEKSLQKDLDTIQSEKEEVVENKQITEFNKDFYGIGVSTNE